MEGLGWTLEQTPQGSGHNTKPDRVQVFGQSFQAQGVTLEVSCAGPGVGLSDPDGSFPVWHVLWLTADPSMLTNRNLLAKSSFF